MSPFHSDAAEYKIYTPTVPIYTAMVPLFSPNFTDISPEFKTLIDLMMNNWIKHSTLKDVMTTNRPFLGWFKPDVVAPLQWTPHPISNLRAPVASAASPVPRTASPHSTAVDMAHTSADEEDEDTDEDEDEDTDEDEDEDADENKDEDADEDEEVSQVEDEEAPQGGARWFQSTTCNACKSKLYCTHCNLPYTRCRQCGCHTHDCNS